MLAKKYRGLKALAVSNLFEGPHKTLSNRFFRINYQFCSSRFPQFVVMTPPRLTKSAVKRNRIRRQLYELIRLHFKEWTVSVRVAILVKKPALEVTKHQQLHSEFLKLLSSLHLSSCPRNSSPGS